MVKIGIIGCGTVSERLALPSFVRNKSARLVAAADPNLLLARRLARKFGISAIYPDYRKLLASAPVDAVYVATPNHLHAPIAVACSRAGKHVLVEKPMCTSMPEARAMIEAARVARVILMVEQYHRFTPTTYAAKKFLDSGALGKILGVRIHIGHQGPQEWSPRGRWFFEKRHAMGGPLADLGIHAIDLLRCLTGKEVSRVACLTWKVRKRIDVEDNACLVMKFSDGTGGTLQANWCQRPGEFSYLLYGEKGTLEFRENRLSAYFSPPDPAKVVPVRIPKGTPTGNAFDHFVRCVRLGERPLVDGREGAKSLEVILAAYESAETGREVKLPLGK